MKNIPRPCVTVHQNHPYDSIKIYIADYLKKSQLPSQIPTQENKMNRLVTDSIFCKGINRKSKYCYRYLSTGNLIIMIFVTQSDDFEPSIMSKANR